MKFVDVKNDIAFLKIFTNANKKSILTSFLNAILGLQGSDRIADVEILSPLQPPIIQNLFATIVDLKAFDGNGKTYVIEMQVVEPQGLDKRLLYYISKEYVQQIETGEDYAQLKPVILIGIFDFPFTADQNYLNHHAFCNVESGERVIKDMDFFFVELPKFNKGADELENITDKWVFFIKNAESLELTPSNLDDEGLAQAYNDAAKFNWTKDELNAYDYAAMREQDARGVKALAEQRAEARGLEKGMELGMESGKEAQQRAFVHRLQALGKSDIEIAELTGLGLERIHEILHP